MGLFSKFLPKSSAGKQHEQWQSTYPKEYAAGQDWARQYYEDLLQIARRGTLKQERALDALPETREEIADHALQYAAPRATQAYFQDVVKAKKIDQYHGPINAFAGGFSATLVDLLIQRVLDK